MSTIPEYRWWKAGEIQKMWPETFLKTREPFCVSACARFLNMSYSFDKMWVLSTRSQTVSALLFQSGKTLFPIFGSYADVTLPVYMRKILLSTPITAIQGVLRDTLIMEKLLAPMGILSRSRMDYDLMSIDSPGQINDCAPLPSGVFFKKPLLSEIETLLPLQSAYLDEEVRPAGAEPYSAKICRAQTEHLLRKEKMITACMGNKFIGKINTSAQSFSRCQIGGVFVAPAWRNRGIASAMCGHFCRALLRSGNPVTLFVRKTNPAALRVYEKVGFQKIADYSIVYMQN
jgi:GNAT superfamily N-acetyltransferase